jgi:hypothetical protein
MDREDMDREHDNERRIDVCKKKRGKVRLHILEEWKNQVLEGFWVKTH